MTSRQPIAVLGATGNQGGHVARALLETGWPVRAITRHPESPRAKQLATLGAQIVQADMGDVGTLIRAFEGAGGIFSVQNFWDSGLSEEVRLGTNVIEAAQRVGNPHVVYSSGLGAERRQGVAAIDGKSILEARLSASRMPFTILRPALFMDDFRGASLPFPGIIRRFFSGHRHLVGRLFLSVLREVFPLDRLAPLTTLQDVGRASVWTWDNPESSVGNTYLLIGDLVTPETLCAMWTQWTGERIPRIPGIGLSVRLAHRRMAQLLSWLSRTTFTVAKEPIVLCSYAGWLSTQGMRCASMVRNLQ